MSQHSQHIVEATPTAVNLFEPADPEAIAFELDGRRISYRSLYASVGKLAHRLVALGVGPGAIVPLCSEPSPIAVAAILAIWRTGAAYVPVDPGWPDGRWRDILGEVAPKVALVQADLIDALRWPVPTTHGAGSTTLRIEPLSEDAIDRLPPAPSAPHLPPPTADQLAYVIYTSGSTGTPKGVMVEHGSLTHTISQLRVLYQLHRADRLLQFAPLCFDVSVEEAMISLAAGATMISSSRAKAGSYQQFLSECAERKISVLELPTAYFNALVEHLSGTGRTLPPSVRLVIIGGEAARPDTLRAWTDLAEPRPLLLNAYGLTETTITTHVGDPVRDAADYRTSRVPIGRPLPGVTQHILDEFGQPTPPGAVGELFVGGTAVTRGYLARPEETSRRFVVKPGIDGSGPERLVATGDLVRNVGDDTLEVVGRIDEQLKLRGFRIEPAEVERALAAHPAVSDVVVGLRDGARKLTAWVATTDTSLTLPDLQNLARLSLPDYMIPRELVALARFPIASSGKVDRHAVKLETGSEPPQQETAGAQPALPIEPASGSGVTDIGLIWQQVLGGEVGSTDANFLSAGGDSLQAMQVLARLRERYGVELTLRQFFADPTVAGLANAIAAASSIQLISRAPGRLRQAVQQ